MQETIADFNIRSQKKDPVCPTIAQKNCEYRIFFAAKNENLVKNFREKITKILFISRGKLSSGNSIRGKSERYYK